MKLNVAPCSFLLVVERKIWWISIWLIYDSTDRKLFPNCSLSFRNAFRGLFAWWMRDRNATASGGAASGETSRCTHGQKKQRRGQESEGSRRERRRCHRRRQTRTD